ncbi:hypothetical protein SLS64_001024 [Diaporthe eres]
MALCNIPANSGSYGVGIRIAFYLQWFGMIVTSWALESDALNLRLINALTTAATSIGLVLNLESLQPVEVYIVLLLTCGTLITKNRILSLQHFQTLCDLIVATTVTAAIELVISWNKITGANDLDSAAQLIPPVITDFLDAYPDMFDLSDLSVPRSVSGYYGMHGGDYVGDEVPPLGDDLSYMPPEPPPAAAGEAASSHRGSRGASVISEEGFIRL